MNKKIYASIVACGIAASFWACGSGEILKPTNDDGTMSEKEVQPVFGVLASQPELCPECGKAVTVASSSSRRTPTTRSSSSGNSTARSSSSQLVINTATSSSVPSVNGSSSSVSGPVPIYSSSSSASSLLNGDPGTCAPEKPTVESGEKVNWVFTNGKDLPGNLLLNSDFTWTTSDGDPASATIGGYKGRTHSVTYATTGKHNASVSILVKTTGVSYNVSCTPVQVNGAPITGCKCTAADKNPDISVGGAWTVTGCTSVGANITTYEWLGATGDGTSATQAFTAKNQLAAPVVNVGNDDNTVVPVQCDTVVSVDANDPDYILTESGVKIQLPKGESTLVLDLPSTWHGNDPKPATLRCDDAGGPVTITVGEETSTPDYSATLSIPIEKTINKSAIVVGLSLAAKCQIAY